MECYALDACQAVYPCCSGTYRGSYTHGAHMAAHATQLSLGRSEPHQFFCHHPGCVLYVHAGVTRGTPVPHATMQASEATSARTNHVPTLRLLFDLGLHTPLVTL